MKIDSFNKIIDGIQASLVWFVVFIITICIATLFLFDVLAGTGSMLYLTGDKMWQSLVISIATTGLLFALMFIGYMMADGKQGGLVAGVGKAVLVGAFLIYIEDIVFDALLADILRYGTIQKNVDMIQWMFRILIGGISTVGDGLAVAMVVGLPVLKNIIGSALQSPKQQNQPQNGHQQSRREVPNSIPRKRDITTMYSENLPPMPSREERDIVNYQPEKEEGDVPPFLRDLRPAPNGHHPQRRVK